MKRIGAVVKKVVANAWLEKEKRGLKRVMIGAARHGLDAYEATNNPRFLAAADEQIQRLKLFEGGRE